MWGQLGPEAASAASVGAVTSPLSPAWGREGLDFTASPAGVVCVMLRRGLLDLFWVCCTRAMWGLWLSCRFIGANATPPKPHQCEHKEPCTPEQPGLEPKWLRRGDSTKRRFHNSPRQHGSWCCWEGCSMLAVIIDQQPVQHSIQHLLDGVETGALGILHHNARS